eukprot:322737-Chlamydomonas_euryale.AAC.2
MASRTLLAPVPDCSGWGFPSPNDRARYASSPSHQIMPRGQDERGRVDQAGAEEGSRKAAAGGPVVRKVLQAWGYEDYAGSTAMAQQPAAASSAQELTGMSGENSVAAGSSSISCGTCTLLTLI